MKMTTRTLLVLMLLAGLLAGTYAQDATATPEPTIAASAGEPLTETPVETSTTAATPDATATLEASPTAPTAISATPLAPSATIPVLAPQSTSTYAPADEALVLVARELFAAPLDAAWSLPEGWVQTSAGDGALVYTPTNALMPSAQWDYLWGNGEIELALSTNGSFTLSTHQSDAGNYSLTLTADTAILSRSGVVLGAAPIVRQNSQRLTLRVLAGVITVWLDDSLVLQAVDAEPLPAGTIALAGDSALSIDTLFVRVPADQPTATPTSIALISVTEIAPPPTSTPISPTTAAPAVKDPSAPSAPRVFSDVAALAAPPNDNYAAAQDVTAELSDGTFETTVMDIYQATLEYNDPYPSCVPDVDDTIWYRYTPSVTHTLNINTFTSSQPPEYSTYDTVVTVYRGSTEVACSDDIEPGVIPGSSVSFTASAGTTYYILVASYWDYRSTPLDSSALLRLWMNRIGIPTLTTPTSGTSYYGNPVLSWTNYNSIASDLQIDNTSTFASPEVSQTNLGGSSFTIPTTLLPGTYYWRVRGNNVIGVAGAWSAVRTFIIAPKNAPALSAPLQNAIISTALPTLTWSAVTGASKYRVMLIADNPANAPVISTVINSSSYTVTTPLGQGNWYWSVMPLDVALNEGAISLQRTFTLAYHTAPANEAILTTTNAAPLARPTFNWAAPRLVTGDVFVEITNNLANWTPGAGFYTSPALLPTATSWTPPAGLLPYGSYYWRVRYVNLPNVTNITHSLHVVPPVPVLVRPASAGIVQNDKPALEWSPVNTTYAPVTYEVQIDNASTFTLPLEATITALTGVVLQPTDYAAGLAAGVHYWRFRSVSSTGKPSAWSSVANFTVRLPAPVTLSAPLDNAIVTTSRPVLSWVAQSGMKYTVALTNLTTAVVTPSPILTTANWTVPTTLPQGSYTWQITVIDAAGLTFVSPTLRSFTVNIQTLPANNAFITTLRPAFSWAAVPGVVPPNGYQLELACDAAFTDKTCLNGLIVPAQTTTSYTPPLTPALPYGRLYWRVNVNYGSGLVVSPHVFTLMITPPAPVAPLLTAPANAATSNQTPVTLAWSPLAGTLAGNPFTYDVQVSTSSAFTGAGVQNTSSATFSAPLPTNGTHYWRVRSVNQFGFAGAWSTARTLIMENRAPNLLAPTNALITTSSRPPFSWQATLTSRSYRWQYSLNGTEWLTENTFTITTPSFTPTFSLPQGTYYWRVIPLDSFGNWGTPSLTRSLTINIQSLPLNDTSTTNKRVAFSWLAVTAPTGFVTEYSLRIFSDAALTSSIYPSAWVRTTSVTIPDVTLLAGIANPYALYWRVDVRFVGTTTTELTSPHGWRLVYAPAVPPSVVQVLPATNSITPDPTPLFTWNASSVAGVTYDLQISRTVNFAVVEQSVVGLSAINLDSDTQAWFFNDGVYYWRVRAVNSVLGQGAWSVVRAFTVDTTAPGIPVLSAPLNAVSLVSLQPTFSWVAVPTATSYLIEWDDTGLFTLPRQIIATGTSYVMTAPLPADMLYWRVFARDSVLNTSDASAIRSITIQTPTNVAPLLNVQNTTSPTLVWTPITNALNYQVQVFAMAAMTGTPVVDATLPGTSLATIALPDGRYYWRVRAQLTATTFTPYSLTRTFEVDG